MNRKRKRIIRILQKVPTEQNQSAAQNAKVGLQLRTQEIVRKEGLKEDREKEEIIKKHLEDIEALIEQNDAEGKTEDDGEKLSELSGETGMSHPH